MWQASEMEVDPSLSQAKAREVSSHPPPLASDAEEGINTSIAKYQTLDMESQAEDQGEKLTSSHKESVIIRPTSPVRATLES